jgi:hypothetical protein
MRADTSRRGAAGAVYCAGSSSIDVEHGVTLEEVDIARDFDAAVGLVARDAVRIDDERAFLALADVGAKFDGLAVGHPDRCGEALHAGRSPQRQNVDAGLGLAVMT